MTKNPKTPEQLLIRDLHYNGFHDEEENNVYLLSYNRKQLFDYKSIFSSSRVVKAGSRALELCIPSEDHEDLLGIIKLYSYPHHTWCHELVIKADPLWIWEAPFVTMEAILAVEPHENASPMEVAIHEESRRIIRKDAISVRRDFTFIHVYAQLIAQGYLDEHSFFTQMLEFYKLDNRLISDRIAAEAFGVSINFYRLFRKQLAARGVIVTTQRGSTYNR